MGNRRRDRGRKPATSVLVILALCVALCLAAARVLGAQARQGTAEARAEYERGTEAAKQKQTAAAIAAFRKAIDLDPQFFDAHERFVSATYDEAGYEKRKDAAGKLRAIYGEWVAAQPRNAVLHYFLGTFEDDPDKADSHFTRAIELDPRFAKAYQELSLHAEMRGETDLASAFLKKAADSAPADPSYAFYYAFSFDDTDLARWKKLALEVVGRFPTHERAAQSLYWLGVRAETEADRLKYLERLKREFPVGQFSWSASGMDELFQAYARSSPDKALALAREMSSSVGEGDRDRWKSIAAMQSAIVKARDLVAHGQGRDALAALDAVKPPKYISITPLHMAKADAQRAMGEPQKAYERLASLVAGEPLPALYGALLDHAKRMGKPAAEVQGDLQARREQQAKPAAEFELENYLDGSEATLAQYRGKVVLLNFWYPG